MNRFQTPCVCLLVLLGTAGVFRRLDVEAAGRAQASPATIADQLDAYADWAAGKSRDVALAQMDLDAARPALARAAVAFLRRGPQRPPLPETYERQRRILVTFALELAATGSKKQAGAAARLVEWACPYVRSHSPLTDFDRAWQLAALAVLEGGIDGRALQAHLDHAQGFLPEPRLLLARGIVEEQSIAPSETSAGPAQTVQAPAAAVEAERLRAAERAIARFHDAEKSENVRAEAALRLGHVQLVVHRYEDALSSWTDVEQATQEPALLYLARLFRGLAYEGVGRNADARAAYAGAASVSPGAHSVSIRLAALAFRAGRADESNRMLEALLRDDDPRRDPWWSYYAGDWRFWYPRIERVR
ncbi:MAG TPA: hypothetical protein VEL79_06270, partial [Vicinamibacterales bacterium]|nr:hypothetical protein [Vicinamibacterales bacterium]